MAPWWSLFHHYALAAQDMFEYYKSRLQDQIHTYMFLNSEQNMQFENCMLAELVKLFNMSSTAMQQAMRTPTRLLPKAKLLSPKTVEKCLNHHWEVRAAEDPAIAAIISDDKSKAELSISAIRVIISDDSGNDPDPATVVLSDDDVSGNESDLAMDAIGVIILDDDYGDEEGSAMRILVSDNDDDEGHLAIDMIVSDHEAANEASGDDEDFGINVLILDDVLSSDEQQRFGEHKMTVDAYHSIYGKRMVRSGDKVGVKGKVAVRPPPYPVGLRAD
ncbi:hypothetical protein DXG01_003938 [Tephrocybe rancida]|nr:hypothetical protein DXG01_003938 [Tephrocybe rancida]